MSKVFISSTGQDLKDYRLAAIETCNQLELVPVAMEFFESMGAGATEGSKKKLESAAVYVGIFAHRYGYIEAGYQHSVTEVEFNYAGGRGLDRLCFLIDPKYPWPPEAVDYKNHERLLAFKAKVEREVIRTEFTTLDDFRLKLLRSLVRWKEQSREGAPPARGPSAEGPADVSKTPDSKAPPPAAMPPHPAIVIGRGGDLRELKERIGVGVDGAARPLTVIRGWPGVGKTTLMAQLAYDPAVRSTFADGVLWVSVGERADVRAKLVGWARTLGADLSGAHTLEETMERVRAVLLDKRALLMIDDVWETNAAATFKVAGPRCATIISTRFQDVARELAATPDDIYLLRQLDDESGLELLGRLAPAVTEAFTSESRQLVYDLEGLPLALRVAGRLLAYEADIGLDVGRLFSELRESSRLLESVAPDDRFDPHTGTTPTINILLKKSTDWLDEQTRDCFAYLGSLAPKPATFDLEAMAAIWEVGEEEATSVARKLVDRGLLEPIVGAGRFQLHAVLVMHARSLLEED
jgi:hypothetical protein